MSAGPQYQALYKQAEQLRFQLRDMLDDATSLSKELLKAADDLIYDLDTNNEPRDVEESIRTIQNVIVKIRQEGEGTMSYSESDSMHRTFENMRQGVRSLDNF